MSRDGSFSSSARVNFSGCGCCILICSFQDPEGLFNVVVDCQ